MAEETTPLVQPNGDSRRGEATHRTCSSASSSAGDGGGGVLSKKTLILVLIAALVLIVVFFPPQTKQAQNSLIQFFQKLRNNGAKSIISSGNTTIRTGEIWLIRHGEKNLSNPHHIQALYELSDYGWKRAFYLRDLVKQGTWPRFSAIFASAFANDDQIQQAYPKLVMDKSGQSMVKREYQTVQPMAAYLEVLVNTTFRKMDTKGVALAAAEAAIDSEGRPVLISWDHCSLPTLIVQGLGCSNRDPACHRCWPDGRFDDVLKLQVWQRKDDGAISSRLLEVTSEGFDKKTTSTEGVGVVNQALRGQPVDEAALATPCEHSYCFDRPAAAAIELQCWCFGPAAGQTPVGDTQWTWHEYQNLTS